MIERIYVLSVEVFADESVHEGDEPVRVKVYSHDFYFKTVGARKKAADAIRSLPGVEATFRHFDQYATQVVKRMVKNRNRTPHGDDRVR